MNLLKQIQLYLVAVLSLGIASCDDTTDFIGSSVIEGADYIEAHQATFFLSSSTVKADTIFTRSSTAYLGKYTHPEFGSFESSFMTQFNVTELYEIPGLSTFIPTGGKQEFLNTPNVYDRSFTPKRIYVSGLYTDYFGDSLAVGRINVYQLHRDLYNTDDIYYSDIETGDFYNESDLLGSSFYSPINLSIPEEDRNNNYLYTSVDLPVEKGKEIMDLYTDCKRNGKSFREEFLKTFKGIYMKQVQGDGAVLYLDQVRLTFTFDQYVLEDGEIMLDSERQDSTVETSFSFSTTKEIVQVNKFRNNTPDDLLDKDTCTYLKSPAGLDTRISIPRKAIADSITAKGDSLNAASFTVFTDSLQEKIDISAPDYLLLIRDTATIGGVFHNYQKEFFADNQLPDGITSFITQAGTKGYHFSNINELLLIAMREYQNAGQSIPETLNLLLIPVSITLDGSTVIGVNHNLQPSYTVLQGGPDELSKRLKLNVYYCRYR